MFCRRVLLSKPRWSRLSSTTPTPSHTPTHRLPPLPSLYPTWPTPWASPDEMIKYFLPLKDFGWGAVRTHEPSPRILAALGTKQQWRNYIPISVSMKREFRFTNWKAMMDFMNDMDEIVKAEKVISLLIRPEKCSSCSVASSE